MKRMLLIYLCSFIFHNLCNAQESFLLEGYITDEISEEPLIAVNVFNQTSTKGTYSDLDGNFEVEVVSFPTILVFSAIGYENLLLKIDEIPSETIDVRLKPSVFNLPGVEIIAKPKVEEISNSDFSIKDFIIKDEKILLMKYGGIKIGNVLELCDLEGRVLHSLKFKIKGVFEKLHQSCLGNIHLVGKKESIEIDIQKNKIEVISKYARIQFEEHIKPCVEASEEYVYLRKNLYLDQYAQFDFVSKNEREITKSIGIGDFENINRISDDLWQERIANNYYSVLSAYTKLPHEVNIARPQWIDGWKVLFFQPLFSPLFNTGNEVCIFNHTQNFLQFYTYEGMIIKQLPISYHKEENWGKAILKDQKTNKFYTVYSSKKGKDFYEINLNNGTVNPVLKMECDFVEKMIIYDGYLYYQDSGYLPGQENRILHKVKVR